MVSQGNNYLKYAGLTLVFVALFSVYAYNTHTGSRNPDKFGGTTVATGHGKTRKMVKGASCCKASFSRSKMLSVKNNHTNIAPQGK
ncbi:hypothetical protein [Daejeonella lutea]|uniref:Uncharacterized protein n=1 Tax=Daejeonella lutea TaxID=572036 RepID=A0A1T5ASC8_9SPHI|nr:hypothetical protein [Daejeonella lutea]SKB37796.1 hypothetical protein SAMN05661099_0987 [Daejeonella lutea]